MEVGEKVNTDAGEVIILDIQKDYLILFNPTGKKFIKAYGYDEKDEKVFWNGGAYYDSFKDLVENLKI